MFNRPWTVTPEVLPRQANRAPFPIGRDGKGGTIRRKGPHTGSGFETEDIVVGSDATGEEKQDVVGTQTRALPAAFCSHLLHVEKFFLSWIGVAGHLQFHSIEIGSVNGAGKGVIVEIGSHLDETTIVCQRDFAPQHIGGATVVLLFADQSGHGHPTHNLVGKSTPVCPTSSGGESLPQVIDNPSCSARRK